MKNDVYTSALNVFRKCTEEAPEREKKSDLDNSSEIFLLNFHKIQGEIYHRQTTG